MSNDERSWTGVAGGAFRHDLRDRIDLGAIFRARSAIESVDSSQAIAIEAVAVALQAFDGAAAGDAILRDRLDATSDGRQASDGKTDSHDTVAAARAVAKRERRRQLIGSTWRQR